MPRGAVVILLSIMLSLTTFAGSVLNSMAQSDAGDMLTCIGDDPKATTSLTSAPDIRPPGREEAQVFPASDNPDSEDGTYGRELYLAVITIPPGECVPFEVVGNHRDGAVIWLVQQGVVSFGWEPIPNTTPVVEVGDNIRTESAPLPALTPRLLYPGTGYHRIAKSGSPMPMLVAKVPYL